MPSRPAGMILAMLLPPALLTGQDTPQEFRIKANYLATLPMFVDFPAQALGGSSFTIGLMGDTPLGPILEGMKGRPIKNRPLAIRIVETLEHLDECQVLFIASSEQYRLQTILPEANRRGILTLSDMRDFVRLGGMVGLVTVNNRISFDLNPAAARMASLSFGTQLLKLANDVTR